MNPTTRPFLPHPSPLPTTCSGRLAVAESGSGSFEVLYLDFDLVFFKDPLPPILTAAKKAWTGEKGKQRKISEARERKDKPCQRCGAKAQAATASSTV